MRYLRLFLVMASLARAADPAATWREDGTPVTNTESRASRDGFGAALLPTSDADWKEKWDTPASETPKFTQIHSLRRGEKAWILIFFANPRPDRDGTVRVTCDVKITRPNGRVTEDRDLEGMKDRIEGAATNTYLAHTVIRFVGEDTDPLGDWIVEVVVHDLNRKVSVPVRTKFTLLETHAQPDRANGGQPIHSGADQTSSAAGSRGFRA